MIPPPSERGFAWRQAAARRVLVCTAVEPYAPHFFTTGEWPLGMTADPTRANEHWAEVAAASGRAALVHLRQVHGRGVVIVDSPPSSLPEGDIVLTDRTAIALAVQAADCVPLLAVDRRTGAIGAAHAGWRGMAATVPGALVEAFASQYGSRPVDLLVAAGPSIGACCYEVGDDVLGAFEAAGFHADATGGWFSAGRPGHFMFDGWSCVGDQLAAAGVPASQIFLSGRCTFCDAAGWPSYRRDGRAAGRLAAVIRVRD